MNPINSKNEYGVLKEVIVGSGFNYQIPMLDLSFKLFFHDNAYMYYNDNMIIDKKVQQELNEDIDEFARVLEGENIKVHRPKILDKIYNIETPYWKSAALPALNVRDQAIILGDTILETSPQVRARYFENDLLKPIFIEKFKQGAKWVQMPKPMMTDESFDQSYISQENTYSIIKNDYSLGFEIMIDGAQMVRFNDDIIINVANRNHLLGYEWLVRQFPDLRFHKINSLSDGHLDSYIVPLKEGLLFLRNKDCYDVLPDFLKKWDIIYCPEITENYFPKYKNAKWLSSPYIDMNVLALGNNKVIANSLVPPVLDVLDKAGMNVIPVQHRHRRVFGGGFHCFTLDLVRE